MDYKELVQELRGLSLDYGEQDSLNTILYLAANAIEELQVSVRGYEMNTDMAFVKEDGRTVIRFIPKVQCPHYRPNHHDRGDDSMCGRFVCEVKALPRWIPVTERLPLLNTPVLATDGIEVDISWMYGVPPRWITSYTAIDEDKLTHWMPLPQTPKGEE